MYETTHIFAHIFPKVLLLFPPEASEELWISPVFAGAQI